MARERMERDLAKMEGKRYDRLPRDGTQTRTRGGEDKMEMALEGFRFPVGLLDDEHENATAGMESVSKEGTLEVVL